MLTEKPKAYSVGAITRLIRGSLEERFGSVWVEGELSNFLHHSSGHRYMSLKDDRAVLKVVMWRSAGAALKFQPKDGQKLLAFGDITVYEKAGQYQLTARRLVPVGVGELELAFRQLHEKLTAEGLFEDDRKQALPAYPTKVGVVTSPTGAAIRDIIQISQRRNRSVQLIIYPAQVQGDEAEATIAEGIDYFNTRDDIDVVITGRGGGSLEDLWPFNTEVVVRAIARSHLPVVSAVGHEIDTTLSDLVADLRAPTPSAAAELVIWSRDEFTERVAALVYRQAAELETALLQARQELDSVLGRPVFARPADLIDSHRQRLNNNFRLLVAAGKNRFAEHKNSLSLQISRLDALSPLKTLARGYSVTRQPEDQQVIRSIRDIKPGDRIETILPDGRVISAVESSTKRK